MLKRIMSRIMPFKLFCHIGRRPAIKIPFQLEGYLSIGIEINLKR
jgi:hypothetical protein